MLHAINHCQNTSLQKSTTMEPPFLPFDESKSCNDCILTDRKYNDQLFFLNQVDLNTSLLDNVLLNKVVVCMTNQKTKECSPTQIKIKDNNQQKEITPQKQEK